MMIKLSKLSRLLLISLMFVDLLAIISAITTTHYNKPHDISFPQEVSEDVKNNTESYFNVTLPQSERQKRLLPYMNFYLKQNLNQPYRQPAHSQQNFNFRRYRPALKKYNEVVGINIQPVLVRQQGKIRVSPFTETNALPGAFVPMKSEQQYQANNQPNFSEIYDKLLQLKYGQQQVSQQGPQQVRYDPHQVVNYAPVKSYQGQQQNFLQPSKIIVQNYTPTQVDVPPPPQQYQQVYQPNYQQRPVQVIQVIDNQKQQHMVQELIGKPVIIVREKQPSLQPERFHDAERQREEERQRIFEEQLRIYEDQQQAYRNEQKLLEEQERRRLAEEERKKYIQIVPKYQVYAQNVPLTQQPAPQHFRYSPIQEYQQNFQIVPEENLQPSPSLPTTEIPLTTEQLYHQNHQEYPVTESPNNLGELLRKLQASNTLPQNLTPENIDNSIKTLVRILNVLKKHQKLSKRPIIVPDQEEVVNNNEDGIEELNKEDLPNTVVQMFPDNTHEGGTPGKPGIDYPALSSIPQTRFSCKTQRYKGFFGDPDTHCQVWHYCDFNGGQASFLCPNGTIFSQVALTCDWWFNVKCSTTAQLYVLNERLYKYILPFAPKFPEDYSGPLVDRYLALKFQEMEEKMRNQKNQEQESKEESSDEESEENSDRKKNDDSDDADQLQKKNEENRKNAGNLENILLEGNNVRRSIS